MRVLCHDEMDEWRRAGVRRPSAQEVCLFDEFGEPIVLETKDLGPTGMFVCADVLLEPGHKLWVSFSVPGGPKLLVRGVVVHGHLGGDGRPAGMGIEFVDLTTREEAWLRRFSNEQPRLDSPWQLFHEGSSRSGRTSAHAK